MDAVAGSFIAMSTLGFAGGWLIGHICCPEKEILIFRSPESQYAELTVKCSQAGAYGFLGALVASAATLLFL